MAERFIKKLPERIIEIKKENIPYEFTLDSRYFFEVRRNVYNNVIYFILYDRSYDENEGKGRILGTGEEKAIIDFPLFFCFNSDSLGNRNPNYPLYDLVPRSIDLNDYDVSYDNIEVNVVMSYEEVTDGEL